MGSNTSKSNNDLAVLAKKNDLDVIENSDPRSPTPEISRTPLQNKSGGKHNITKNVDLRKTFESANGEEKLIHNNPILSAVIKNHLQSYDPRSPTQDFERTPVIITSQTDVIEVDKKLLKLQNELNCASPVLKSDPDDSCDSCTEAKDLSPDQVVPKNLCHGFFDMTLNNTLKDAEEPLGSSTASNEAIENNISDGFRDNKPTKLLETNFDYVESYQDKFEDSEENIQGTDDHQILEIEFKNTPLYKILNVDPRSPSIGIERTPIVVSKIEEETSEDNVEEMSDDTLMKVLQCTNAELRQTVTKPLDKNTEGLMIYEDDSNNLNETPKKSKTGSNSGSRTPLSCMKNKADMGHTRSKSVNTLYDPKGQKGILSKIPKRVSHIPRLKTLTNNTNPKLIPTDSSVSLKNITKSAAMGGVCENTPPHSHRDRWDKDNSIVL